MVQNDCVFPGKSIRPELPSTSMTLNPLTRPPGSVRAGPGRCRIWNKKIMELYYQSTLWFRVRVMLQSDIKISSSSSSSTCAARLTSRWRPSKLNPSSTLVYLLGGRGMPQACWSCGHLFARRPVTVRLPPRPPACQCSDSESSTELRVTVDSETTTEPASHGELP